MIKVSETTTWTMMMVVMMALALILTNNIGIPALVITITVHEVHTRPGKRTIHVLDVGTGNNNASNS